MVQQSAIGFLESQTAHIEREAYMEQYPFIQYPQLVPVSTEAPEWTSGIVHYSSDGAGAAAWFNPQSSDVPLVDVTREQHSVSVATASIGYYYTVEELSQAMMIPGYNLNAERAMFARRAAEEMLDDICLRGDTEQGWDGLINSDLVTDTNVATKAGGGRTWEGATAEEILRDINDAITTVYTDSKQIEMPDTVALPVESLAEISWRQVSTQAERTILQYLQQANVYTVTTGRPLMIKTIRGLETAGASSTKRMVVYARDPQVLKFHLPMPHKFLAPQQSGPLKYEVPGVFRTAGLEIRRPKAILYRDGI